MPDQVEIAEEFIFVPGEAGNLEAILTYPESEDSDHQILIAGPHPLLGGDMENNVVRQLSLHLAENKISTLRFNYRGVGLSDGERINSTDNIAQFLETSHIESEADFYHDLISAGSYLEQHLGRIDYLVGYSFGASLCSRWLTEKSGVKGVVLISPTIEKHDYQGLRNSPVPKLIISSEDDFAVPVCKLNQLYSEWQSPKKLMIEKFDNHFYRGYETWLAEKILDFTGDRNE